MLKEKSLLSVHNLISLVLYGNVASLKIKLPDIPQELIFQCLLEGTVVSSNSYAATFSFFVDICWIISFHSVHRAHININENFLLGTSAGLAIGALQQLSFTLDKPYKGQMFIWSLSDSPKPLEVTKYHKLNLSLKTDETF